MKTIFLKLDNYLLDLLNQESKEKKTTRMELIRSAIISFLINKDDAQDLAYIHQHKQDRLLPFNAVFK